MTTTDDRKKAPASQLTSPSGSRRWAVAGLVAGVASIISIAASSMADGVYDSSVAGDPVGIVNRLADQVPQILVMHTCAMISAVLLLVFGPGLRHFLKARVAPDSLLLDVASGGLMLVAVAQLMGSALTTEFVFGLTDPEQVLPENGVLFAHWIGTVPWLWVGAGVSALAVGLAGRRFGAVPTWLAWTSLVLGGLITVIGISPLQYLAGMIGPLWLTLAAVGVLRCARKGARA